jgi:cytochrome oxidase Cu insertion factor (SCO1/SenC/PrrC family)
MSTTSHSLGRIAWVGFVLVLALLSLTWLASLRQLQHNKLPPLPVIGPVADFSLTNQDGVLTTLKDLTNHVWVADIVFTRCGGPCPRMTGQMKSLEDALPGDSQAQLVTMTTDPDFDTPPVLHRYSEHYKADTGRWHFLTGTKAQIAALAGDSLKLSAVPVKPEDRKDDADLFIHTTIFVVVDKHAQLRGAFETGGDGVDWAGSVRPKLLQTIRHLEREP